MGINYTWGVWDFSRAFEDVRTIGRLGVFANGVFRRRRTGLRDYAIRDLDSLKRCSDNRKVWRFCKWCF